MTKRNQDYDDDFFEKYGIELISICFIACSLYGYFFIG